MEVGASAHLTHSGVLCMHYARLHTQLWKWVPPHICPIAEYSVYMYDARLPMQLWKWVPPHSWPIAEYCACIMLDYTCSYGSGCLCTSDP